MTKANPNIHIPSNYTPQMTVVIPGRRALGESWTQVEIGVRNDQVVAEARAVEAPPSQQPFAVLHGEDAKYAEDLLAMMNDEQRASLAGGTLTDEDRQQIMRDWMQHIENKLKWLKGQTQIGASGRMTQRQKVHQNPTTRPAPQFRRKQ